MFAGGFLGFLFILGAVLLALAPYIIGFSIAFFVVYTLWYISSGVIDTLAGGFNFIFGSVFTSADLLDLLISIVYVPIWIIGALFSGIGSILSFIIPSYPVVSREVNRDRIPGGYVFYDFQGFGLFLTTSDFLTRRGKENGYYRYGKFD